MTIVLPPRRQPLAERLLQALKPDWFRAGRRGRSIPQRSSFIMSRPFRWCRLRVDWDDENPVMALRRLWDA